MKRLGPERGTLEAVREALDYARDWNLDSQAAMAKIGAVENAIEHLVEYLEGVSESRPVHSGVLVVPDDMVERMVKTLSKGNHPPTVVSRSDWERGRT